MNTFPIPDHIVLFGGSPLLVETAKMLRERNLHVDIYTSPRQEAEPIEDGLTLGQVLVREGMDWYETTADINRDMDMLSIGPFTMGIGFGEAWQFSQAIIDAFGGRLLDFMGIPLPRYRGAAHYTWAIMNQATQWGCCMQRVTAGTIQGEYDDGEVVYKDTYTIISAITPQEWFDDCGRKDLAFLRSFFDLVMSGHPMAPQPVDEKRSLFFPRLKTSENGWVDWSWQGDEICDFINAFDQPYPGAHTTLDGETVQMRYASWQEGAFHPFAAGLVVRTDADNVYLATRGGLLQVGMVLVNGDNIIDVIKPGQRFYTSRERLERALTYTPRYSAMGDEAQKPAASVMAGKKIYLRPISMNDCTEQYVAWLNDPEVNRYLESRFREQSIDTVRQFVRTMIQSPYDHLFAICEKDSDRHIGNIKIGGVNDHHGYADVGYFLGDKSVWGHGYATEAIKLATEYAFKALKIFHMRAGVYEKNVGSCKALRKAGYSFQGIWEGQLMDGTERTGHAWYSITADVMETAK